MSKTIHFGVVDQGDPGAVEVDGHSDPFTEHPLAVGGRQAYVSGSWYEWGIDPDGDHDATLHVAVEIRDDAPLDPARVASIRENLAAQVTRGRLLDYAIVSEGGDWSNQTVLIYFDGPHGPRFVLTDRASSASRQHYIDTGRYLAEGEALEAVAS